MSTNDNQQAGNAIDWNKIITELIVKHEEAFVKSISGHISSVYKKSSIKLGAAYKTYLLNAMEKYSKVKTLLYRNAPRDLYEFYEFNDIECDDRAINCEHTETLLSETHFSIVLGDGGSGKSMLMRHLFINALQELDSIPVFIELRNFDNEMTLSDYIYKSLCTLGFTLEKEFFEYSLKYNKFIFLLDGYDEIGFESQKSFFTQLESFCDLYSQHYYIVSSRRQDTFIGWQRFTVFDILPLSKERAINLIAKLDYDKDIKTKFLQKLSSKLYEQHISFASNPLLLSIMLITFDQYGEIPEKLHIFYSSAFDAMYSMHDATKGGYKRERMSNLSCDEFRNVFAKFCFVTYVNGNFEFNENNAISYLKTSGKGIESFDATAFLHDLQVAVCLIIKDGPTFQFTHRSFQEYFVSFYLNQLNDKQQQDACRIVLSKSSARIGTDNVFRMLKDMGESRFEKNFIIPILTEIDNKNPNLQNILQRYFYGLIDYCYISLDLKKLFINEKCHLVCPLSGEDFLDDKEPFLGVKMKRPEDAGIFTLISELYQDPNEKVSKKKLATRHWERKYSPEEIWNDAILQKHMFTYTQFGKELKTISTLLPILQSKTTSKETEFQEMLNGLL